MWSKVLRLLIGIGMLPLCVAVTLGLIDLLNSLPPTPAFIAPETLALLGGYFIWLGLYLCVMRPMHAYVWAHELTHALWGLLFLAKIHAIRVKPTGGAVSLSKSNTLIALAPYFFPFYTMVVLLLRWIISIWIPMDPYELAWLFLVGFTWGFHFTFTVQTLLIRQPDIVDNGRVFSLTLIYLLNLAGIGLWVVCTTPATCAELGGFLVDRIVQAYLQVASSLSDLALCLYKLCAD
jgi:hypothetical protein